uniref:Uncharacterized protein LOC117360698 n=1 Tax=Geotrypetes seraphini TaxID=260995 RepID=A0A6P8RGA0_GEOSA|nr:uncharacterized protein LOC117360698 [Geotrypetes seraphini]
MRKAWKSLCRLLKINSRATSYLPIAGNGDFIPGLDSGPFRRWTSVGLQYISQVVQSTGLPLSFTDLTTQFHLTATDWFAYRQLQHYLRNLTPAVLCEESYTKLQEVLGLTAQDLIPLKLYHGLLLDCLGDLDFPTLARKWSMDLQVPITADMIRRGLCLGNALRLSSMEWERNYKFLLRAFYPPKRAHVMGISAEHGCGKCEQPMASFGHMFWTCPMVSAFWLQLVSAVARIWGCSWRLHPSFLITLQIRFHPPKPGCSAFIKRTILLGRKCVLLQWLSSQPPTIQQWRALMLQQMLLERRDIVDMSTKTGRLFRQCWYSFSLTFTSYVRRQLWDT